MKKKIKCEKVESEEDVVLWNLNKMVSLSNNGQKYTVDPGALSKDT